MKFLYLIVIIVVIILAGCTTFAVQNTPDTARLSFSAKLRFLNWFCQNKKCSDTTIECEKYFETVHHLPCYLVYGHRDFGTDDWAAHMWNIVMMDGVPYEFESTTFVFKDVSETYTIQDIQEGFYMNGVKYEKSQKLNNWENIL